MTHTRLHGTLIALATLLASLPAWAMDPAKFVGADTCRGCHQAEYDLWQDSHHDWAMRPATAENVLGDFDDVEYDHYGVKSRFYKRGDVFYVHTDNAKGKMQEFRISYTFGFYPLQQYLIAFPDGRYQTLSVAWDSRPASEGGQRWFHLYPDQAIPHDDILHWTGTYQNWNSRCAACHSTNLRRNYDQKTDSYDTQWSEINVSCEACHGPGKAHAEWAKKPDTAVANMGLTRDISAVGQWLRDSDASTAHNSVDTPSMSGQIAACGSCHSRRSLVDDVNLPGNFHNKHRLELLSQPLYHPDGQIAEEVYVLGSFMQSKMFHEGVVCSNCHEPHSLTLRAEGNGVCTQCHSAPVYDSPKHHHHPIGEGSQCVNCHMPETNYMQVDPRRDHSIRIPRPDLSDKLDTPNACTQCHTNKGNDWAADTFTQWLDQLDKKPATHYGEAMAVAQQGGPGADRHLIQLARNGGLPGIVRATALSQLLGFPGRETLSVARENLNDADPLVRRGAVLALEMLPVEQRLTDLLPLLRDPIKTVRLEATRLLVAVPDEQLTSAAKASLKTAMVEYLDALQMHADTPNGQLNLGAYYLARQDFEQAEKAYRHALLLNSQHLGAYMNLADLYRLLDRESDAEKLLRQATEIAPQQGAPQHALGLSLVRQKRYAQAEVALARAAELEPENIRYGYVYAVALNSFGKTEAALDVLTDLHRRQPDDADVLYALLDIHRGRGNWAEALKYGEKLLQLRPGNSQLEKLVNYLKSQSHEG
jgi:tetratricopeptide (TPR) repeat protein